MKNKLIDIADMVEKILRAMFWLGLGMFLSMKALVVLIQPSLNCPEWLLTIAFILPVLVTVIIAMKVMLEPTPKERREAKEREKMFYKWLEEIEEKSKIRQGGDANKRG